MGEGNSVSCGGRRNVSDVFGAALYALDVQMHLALVGAAQWNWHGGPGAAYAPVSFARTPGAPGPPDVRPLFYGMWAFATATANGSSILEAAVSSSNPLIKAWALRSPSGYSVLCIHKDPAAAGSARVAVTMPPGIPAREALLARLVAPSVTAPYGVTFAGQTFDSSVDGLPLGQRVRERVPVDASGEMAFTLAPASAAILSIQV